MSRVVKQYLLEFIIPRGMQNWFLLGESLQAFFEIFVMHKTEMPFGNVSKNFQR